MVSLRETEIAFHEDVLTQCCTKIIQRVLRIVLCMLLILVVTAFVSHLELPSCYNWKKKLHLEIILIKFD